MIRDNIIAIKGRISAACARVNRDPGSITVVAVSKNRRVQEVEEALRYGISDIGENRVQEALLKYDELRASGVKLQARWHMVGHLQTNKVQEAVKLFDLIQSVDSLRLAQEIDEQAAKIDKIQDILLEIKTSPELSKSGIMPDDASWTVKDISGLTHINIKGLMTIAPLVDDPETARPYFRMLRELGERINQLQATGIKLNILSMGMTDDFEVAIEEGATMVRLGRGVFEG